MVSRHAGLLEIAEAIFVANAKRQKAQGIHFFQLYQRHILLAMQLPGWVGFNIRSISEEYCRDLLMLFMGWMLSIELWHGPLDFASPAFIGMVIPMAESIIAPYSNAQILI